MPLDKDILGQLLYEARASFDDKTIDELTTEFGGLEEARLAMAKRDAEAIITHFQTAGVVNVEVVTVGSATTQSGPGTGTIS